MTPHEFVPDRSLGTSHASAQHAEAEAVAAQHRKAVRFIASSADDAADCVVLLDALGLTAQEGKS